MTKNTIRTIIHPNWLSTDEGESIFLQLYDTKTAKGKLFGVLEKPKIQVDFEEVSYKLFFIGKAGCEKNNFISELTGISVPSQDSNGIHKTNIYWPTKIWDKVILFRLQCWEAGDSGVKKFSHILPACMDKTDALVFIFSFDDLNSFCEMSPKMLKMKGNEPNPPATIVIGTRYASHKKLAVSFNKLKEFETKWLQSAIKLPTVIENQNRMSVISSVLNAVCEQLWVRDQEYILQQSSSKFACKE